MDSYLLKVSEQLQKWGAKAAERAWDSSDLRHTAMLVEQATHYRQKYLHAVSDFKKRWSSITSGVS